MALLGACDPHPNLRLAWVEPELLGRGDDFAKDASAVVLYRGTSILLHSYLRSQPDYTQVRRHEATRVLAEPGIDEVSEVRLLLSAKSKLLDVWARTLSPTGQETRLSRADMHESSSPDAEGLISLAFRFPNVVVGSTVEYAYVVEEPWLDLGGSERVATSKHPVLSYEFTLTANEPLHCAVKQYNTTVAPKLERRGDSWHFVWGVSKTPGESEEAFDPHWTFTDPWIAYRVLSYVYDRPYPLWSTWTDVAKWRARQIYLSDEFAKGFEERLSTEGCADGRCTVERGVQWVSQRINVGEFGKLQAARPLAQVVAGRSASAHEAALLLREVLANAGVDARVALTTRKLTERFVDSFPSLDRLNHTLVYVPSQKGLDKPLWIDPSCTYCALGELPPWSLGVTALVIKASVLVSGMQPEFETILETTSATKTSGASERLLQARLSPQGDLAVTDQRIDSGIAANWLAAEFAGETQTDRRKDAEKYVAARAKTARLTNLGPRACDSAKKTCRSELSYSVPGYATVEGDRMLVPLTVLVSDLDETFESATRKREIVITKERQYEQELTVTLPPGYVLDGAPMDEATTSSAVDGRVRIRTSDGVLAVTRG